MAAREGTIVIGIGNPDRGDDAAGRMVARRLRGRLPPGIAVREHDGEPATLLASLEDVAAAYLVDACTSGAPAGHVHRFDVVDAPLPQESFGLSSHALGLPEAVELARVLGQLPPRCVVYAIEGESFMHGRAVSSAVKAGVDEAVRRIARELCDAPQLAGEADA